MFGPHPRLGALCLLSQQQQQWSSQVCILSMAEIFSLAFMNRKLVASSPTTSLLIILHSPFSLIIQVVIRCSHAQKYQEYVVPQYC